jgi:hypothetical protein
MTSNQNGGYDLLAHDLLHFFCPHKAAAEVTGKECYTIGVKDKFAYRSWNDASNLFK